MKDTKKYQKLEENDRILFDSRTQPLKVKKLEDDQIKIEGPSGGEYILFIAEKQDRVLISKEGARDYASYIDNLRKVGEWQKTGKNKWSHSKSNSEFRLEKKDTGYWTIRTDDFNVEEEIDLPMYGYSDREFAREDLKKIIKKHPEG